MTDKRIISESLPASELFYRDLFAHSIDGILITDENGWINFVSASVLPVLGYLPEDISGTSMFDYVHPNDKELGATTFKDEVNKAPQVRYISIRLLSKEGEWIWCRVRGHNLMENPHVKGMVIYFADDNKQKETENLLHQSEESFKSLIQNLSQGVIVLNKHARVLACNRACCHILGLAEGEILGKGPGEFNWDVIKEDGSEFPGFEHPGSLAVRMGVSVKDIVMGIWSNSKQERIWLIVSADPNLDSEGQLLNVVISFTDITEQKRLSLELFKHEMQRQKLLTQATIDGQEKERMEMGKELHDNINQHLNTTRLYLEVAKEKASGEVSFS